METTQQYTTLNNGVRMPLLGLGTYNMHGKEAEKAVDYALEAGYRLIDTAAMYSNETEIGHAVQQSGLPRQELFITTKVNNSDQGYDATLRAFDTSLQKLGLDYVDLYLLHWPIKGKRKDTWKAIEKIYQSEKVKAIGVANYLIPFLEELKTYSTVVPAVNQVEFSPFLYAKDLLHYCKERQIQLQAYTPIVRGEKLKDHRLQQLAKKYGKSPAQIILRWDMEHGVSAIPKSSHPDHIQENFDIFDFSLSADDLALLDTLNEDLRLVGDPMRML